MTFPKKADDGFLFPPFRKTHQKEIYPIKITYKQKSRTAHKVAFTMPHSAARLSFSSRNLLNEGQQEIPRPAAFRPHLAMGSALAILWVEK
jgi:hypothetical protein